MSATRAERVATIRELRDQGLLMREIGGRLGLATQTINDYLNDPNGDRVRARKASYRGSCVQCGASTNGSNGRSPNAPKLCFRCARIEAAERSRMEYAPYRRLVEEMWAEGMTAPEIGRALGWKTKHPGAHISRFRSRGYNLPHRRTPEQMARICADQGAHIAKAREVYKRQKAAA